MAKKNETWLPCPPQWDGGVRMWEHRQTHPLEEERERVWQRERDLGTDKGKVTSSLRLLNTGRLNAQKDWERLQYFFNSMLFDYSNTVVVTCSFGRHYSRTLSRADSGAVGRPTSDFLSPHCFTGKESATGQSFWIWPETLHGKVRGLETLRTALT